MRHFSSLSGALLETERTQARRPEPPAALSGVFGGCSGDPLFPRERKTRNRRRARRMIPGFLLAVAVGFEPTVALTTQHFECCTFGLSDTLPGFRVPVSSGDTKRMWRDLR